jgi:hypothetical protein
MLPPDGIMMIHCIELNEWLFDRILDFKLFARIGLSDRFCSCVAVVEQGGCNCEISLLRISDKICNAVVIQS